MQVHSCSGGIHPRYLKIATEIANCAMRGVRGDYDSLAMGVEDYTSELVLRAWLSVSRWRARPDFFTKTPDDELRYVCRSLWSKVHTFERNRYRKGRMAARVYFTEEHAGIDASFEDRAMARETLKLLKARLAPREWGILCEEAATSRKEYPALLGVMRRFKKKSRKAIESLSEIRINGVRCTEGFRFEACH